MGGSANFSSAKVEFLNTLLNIHFQYWVTRATPKEDEEGNNNNNNNNNNMGTSKGKRRKSEKKEEKERRRESQVEERYGVDVGLQVHYVSVCPNIS